MYDSTELNWMISVDDHLFEPPDLWSSRAATRDLDRVPRVVRSESGHDVWAFEDVRSPIYGVLVQAGREQEVITPDPINYSEMLPAYYDSQARLEYMDRDGVLASMCFPFFPRFCGQTFSEASDRSLALKCLMAWNDWSIEGWAGAAPGRFIPMCIIPLWDPKLAAKEIERCASSGAKAVAFSENPHRLGYPSIHDANHYWDPVFRAAEACRLPLAIHFGSSSSVPTTSPDAPILVGGSLHPMSLAFCMADWLFSGNLPRHPNLKILMCEGGIGWIPYMLERVDNIVKTQEWTRHSDFTYDLGSGAAERGGGAGLVLDELPSDLFRNHFYGCFIDDPFGCQNLDRIGVDNVLIETDFPHGDSTYPNSLENAHEQLRGQDNETIHKILQGNARDLFALGPALVPSSR